MNTLPTPEKRGIAWRAVVEPRNEVLEHAPTLASTPHSTPRSERGSNKVYILVAEPNTVLHRPMVP